MDFLFSPERSSEQRRTVREKQLYFEDGRDRKVIDYQWVREISVLPCAPHFESAPFSHLGTSPETSLLYQRTKEKSSFFLIRRLLFCKLQDFTHFTAYGGIVFPPMGTQALSAIFNSCFRVSKTAAATITKAVKRTITKQTAEAFRISILMTGKKLTFFVLKKIVMAYIEHLTSNLSSNAAPLHRSLPIHFPELPHCAEWFWQRQYSLGHKP